MPRRQVGSCAARGRLQGQGPSCPDGCRVEAPGTAGTAHECRPAAAAADGAPCMLAVAWPRHRAAGHERRHCNSCPDRLLPAILCAMSAQGLLNSWGRRERIGCYIKPDSGGRHARQQCRQSERCPDGCCRKFRHAWLTNDVPVSLDFSLRGSQQTADRGCDPDVCKKAVLTKQLIVEQPGPPGCTRLELIQGRENYKLRRRSRQRGCTTGN